jgi:hypothetical protein
MLAAAGFEIAEAEFTASLRLLRLPQTLTGLSRQCEVDG